MWGGEELGEMGGGRGVKREGEEKREREKEKERERERSIITQKCQA